VGLYNVPAEAAEDSGDELEKVDSALLLTEKEQGCKVGGEFFQGLAYFACAEAPRMEISEINFRGFQEQRHHVVIAFGGRCRRLATSCFVLVETKSEDFVVRL
jgi:hypothetical protein